MKLLGIAALLIFLPCAATAQIKPDDWMRVQSDDGEFSIEVPAQYRFFVDEDGFSESENSNNYQAKNMNMLNAYFHGTLLSFESYEAKKGAIDAFYDHYTYRRNDLERSTQKTHDYSIRQTVDRNGGLYFVRQYFNSKKHIYILSAASRNGETPEIRRFLGSLRFSPGSVQPTDPGTVSLSKLKVSEVTIEMRLEKSPIQGPQTPASPALPKDDDKSWKSLTILAKPRASYVDLARMKNVTGTVRIKLTFAADGFTPKIVVLQTLPEGLLRQTIFAALRMKFLPREKDNVPDSVDRVVEYTFTIY